MNSPALLPTPEASPAWLRPLVENATEIRGAYRNRVPRSVLAAITAASAAAALTGDKRDAAVLVLFSGSPDGGADGTPPADADLLVTALEPGQEPAPLVAVLEFARTPATRSAVDG